jgi:hypothetical protein
MYCISFLVFPPLLHIDILVNILSVLEQKNICWRDILIVGWLWKHCNFVSRKRLLGRVLCTGVLWPRTSCVCVKSSKYFLSHCL